jgi:predicted metal-dependent phosphotriesterase family hydrolase
MSQVQTVTGPVDAREIGFTLPHEHLFLSMWENNGRGSIQQLADDEVLAGELQAFRAAGGSCLVDQTPRGCGREPRRVRELAEKTEVFIVMGCGWYMEPFYPPEDTLARRSVASIAGQLVEEIEHGLDGTQVRPGMIGEIGAAQGWLSPLEERVHRAAARAHLHSGLPIATHTTSTDAGVAQLDLFEEEGVDLRRVCVGHCDSQPYLEYCTAIAQRGAYVAFDNLGLQMGQLEDRLVHLIKELAGLGFDRQVLLSQDVGQMPELRYFGGRGFTYLTEDFVPKLLASGLSQDVVDIITIDNPKRFLSIS